MTCKNRTRPSALTSSGSDTQNWYHEKGHIARNNAITSTIQAKFAVISRADATTPVRAGDKCQFGVVRTTCVSLVLSGQHVSVWCFTDNMCQFDVVRTTCVNLVLSGEVSVCVVRTSVSLVLSEQHVSVWCCPEKCQFGVFRRSVSLVLSGQVSVWCCLDNMCQFGVARTSVSLVLSGQHVSLVLSGEVSVSGCPDNKCQFGCPDNNCQFGVVRTISVSLVSLTKG